MANISIQPINIWVNGQTIAGNNLDAYQIYNNGVSESNFYYQVQKDTQSLINGNISITGNDYNLWMANSFSTEWALTFICTQLNLTPIIPTKTKK
jgi:filamentous hemagglutinin family protein